MEYTDISGIEAQCNQTLSNYRNTTFAMKSEYEDCYQQINGNVIHFDKLERGENIDYNYKPVYMGLKTDEVYGFRDYYKPNYVGFQIFPTNRSETRSGTINSTTGQLISARGYEGSTQEGFGAYYSDKTTDLYYNITSIDPIDYDIYSRLDGNNTINRYNDTVQDAQYISQTLYTDSTKEHLYSTREYYHDENGKYYEDTTYTTNNEGNDVLNSREKTYLAENQANSFTVSEKYNQGLLISATKDLQNDGTIDEIDEYLYDEQNRLSAMGIELTGDGQFDIMYLYKYYEGDQFKDASEKADINDGCGLKQATKQVDTNGDGTFDITYTYDYDQSGRIMKSTVDYAENSTWNIFQIYWASIFGGKLDEKTTYQYSEDGTFKTSTQYGIF